jgi:hypothetical protein
VESFTGPVRQLERASEPAATTIFDVRDLPLEELWADDDVCNMVDRIMDSMDGSSRVSVAKFNSAI